MKFEFFFWSIRLFNFKAAFFKGYLKNGSAGKAHSEDYPAILMAAKFETCKVRGQLWPGRLEPSRMLSQS